MVRGLLGVLHAEVGQFDSEEFPGEEQDDPGANSCGHAREGDPDLPPDSESGSPERGSLDGSLKLVGFGPSHFLLREGLLIEAIAPRMKMIAIEKIFEPSPALVHNTWTEILCQV